MESWPVEAREAVRIRSRPLGSGFLPLNIQLNQPGEGKAPHSRILAWEIPWAEEPDGLQSMDSHESDTTQQLNNTNPVKSHPKLHCPWIKASFTFPYRLHGIEERGVIWQEDRWFDLWFSNICCIRITCKFVKNTSSWAPPTDSGGLGGAREFQQVPR